MLLALMDIARIRPVILTRVLWIFLTIYAAAPLGAYRCLRLDNRDWYLYPCLGTGKTIADGYPEKGLCCFGLFPSLAVSKTYSIILPIQADRVLA